MIQKSRASGKQSKQDRDCWGGGQRSPIGAMRAAGKRTNTFKLYAQLHKFEVCLKGGKRLDRQKVN